MGKKDYFEKVKQTVGIISQDFFIDTVEEEINGKKVEFWNTMMSVFAYLGNKNTLLIGSKGTGKTTVSSVVSSVLSGLPFDLFDTLKIQGQPEATKDTLMARADLGRLAEEGVVWQATTFLPAVVIDEINRLPPGKQAMLMEYIRTGAIEHLGKYFSRDKFPFFATMNYNGPGTYPIPVPSLDRFDICLETPAGPAFVRRYIEKAVKNIDNTLKHSQLTETIVNELLRKDIKPAEKLEYLKKTVKLNLKKFGIPELGKLNLEEVLSTEMTPDANAFLDCIWEEFNTTWLYGDNRSSDIRDVSQHNKAFASSKVNEGISQRAWDSIKYFSCMLANYLGSEKVEIEHVKAVAPYCISHKLEFTDDYKANFADKPREIDGKRFNERENIFLARNLVKTIKENYDAISYELKILDEYIAKGTTDTKKIKEVERIIKGPEPDHPLLRQYWQHLKGKIK